MKKISKTKIEKRLQGKENPRLRNLIITLKKQKQLFWHQVAKELATPSRRAARVNIFKLNKHAKDKETILVPGKVLSAGSISKQVRVAAFSFSKIAREKIKHAGGSTMQIEELLKSPDKTARILR
ncbi:MAG TPA: 50S ribosomal protein L18e [Nanoarchaeota archaeon]|nr:MAG: large subunit ribosomal protein L18e [archaeon GW2011_AR6]MBS3082325.1 50S ribosomal protein L18e [Candidatus Pacearchaeota archaeon]HIH18099.1 50S ribosomal protein L18e [Nanoarchaeota archaeon]HIH34010.1 50S ribosomal protein L18e [Nanoarchaeota archaeon]HIH51051.1 50S ribosomal protein L18e [Nanoarchaeota archaeon]